MRPLLLLAVALILGCREERGSMFEVSRSRAVEPRPVCGEAPKTVSCSALSEKVRPPRAATPRVAHRVEPVYPAEARRRGISGAVILEVGIRRDGSVGGVCVLKPLPCGLTDAAADAVRQWRFEPQERNVVASVTVQFRP